MKKIPNERSWYLIVAVALVASSALIYSIQLIFFHRPGETYFYMMQDLAFVPVQVLIVTIVIDRMLKYHEKKQITKKIYVGVGLFFSETGNNLLKLLIGITENRSELSSLLDLQSLENKKKFKAAVDAIKDLDISVKHDTSVLLEMKSFLADNKKFLVDMLENSNLTEHDQFTDLLLAISHLADELRMRPGFESLPPADIKHLSNDMIRAYKRLIVQWIYYMIHIKNDYPFLYSLAARSNPFKSGSSVIIYEG